MLNHYIEPHKLLLHQITDDQLLYKFVKVDDFNKSIGGNYLHFNRVDSYKDFEGADLCDGEQLPLDRNHNKKIGFVKSPSFTAEKYYDISRSRTYACCFSLEESDYMWEKYRKDGICLIFEFGKLRQALNQALENSTLRVGNMPCQKIFSINYGVVDYISKEEFINQRQPNPIQYTFSKDNYYQREKEFRVALSALGIGTYLLQGCKIPFLVSLQFPFDFKKAFKEKIIMSISCDHSMNKKLNKILTQREIKPIYD